MPAARNNSNFRPISEYAAIGNCRSTALVSSAGSIDWCCFPLADRDPYFSRLLDSAAGGMFALSPLGPCSSSQCYRDDTNVLETRFRADGGSATLTDAFVMTDPDVSRKRLDPEHEILRIVECDRGEMKFELRFKPRRGFDAREVPLRPWKHFGIRCESGGGTMFLLRTSIPESAVSIHEHEARAEFTLRAGERAIFSLSCSWQAPAVLPLLGDHALGRLGETERYWRKWAARCRYSGEHEAEVRRSALALKLLSFAPSGAILAAPTSSLPEHIGGSRNWDYRYCWLRDASFTIRALIRLGYHDEATAFLNWMIHSTRLSWPRLQVVYSVYGETKLHEKDLRELEGYAGSRPVRMGNAASKQFQLDIYGEVIESFASLAHYLHPVDSVTVRMIQGFGQAVANLWQSPDEGIWEPRTPPTHHVHSKLMAWVAMDRLAHLSARHRWKLKYDARGIASQIRAWIEKHGYDPVTRSYIRAQADPSPDASLLLMPIVGYCSARDPRFVATREHLRERLGVGGFLYRYPPGSDGIEEPEGAFTLCNFWLSEAYALAGNIGRAREYFRAVVSRLNPCKLAPEELDPKTGAYLGNYPQGFSHVGLINAALTLEEGARRKREVRVA